MGNGGYSIGNAIGFLLLVFYWMCKWSVSHHFKPLYQFRLWWYDGLVAFRPGQERYKEE